MATSLDTNFSGPIFCQISVMEEKNANISEQLPKYMFSFISMLLNQRPSNPVWMLVAQIYRIVHQFRALARACKTSVHCRPPCSLARINGGILILSSETLLRPSLGYLDAFRQPPYLLLITVSQENGSYHRWSGKVRGY